jgi:hypothetical protein
MKNLQNLKGAHLLSKKEQQSINGGTRCQDVSECPPLVGCESSIPNCNFGVCFYPGC